MPNGTRGGAAQHLRKIGVIIGTMSALVVPLIAAPAIASATPGLPLPFPPAPPAPSVSTPPPVAPEVPTPDPVPAPTTPGPAPTVVAPGDRIEILQRSLGNGNFETLQCTMGFAVTAPNGERLGVTAGHCGGPQFPVGVQRWIVGEIVQSQAPEVREDPERPGNYSPVDPFAPDWATFRLTDPTVRLLASSPQVAPRSLGFANIGDPVCQVGATNGQLCGTVTRVEGDWVTTDITTTQGDSGGPLVRTTDNAALGIITDAVTLTDSDSGEVTGRMTQYYALPAVLRGAGNAQLATG